MTQSRCRSKRVQMLKGMALQLLRVNTPNWWGDRCSWNGPRSCKTMEQLISQRNTSPMAIKRRPLISFAIANNLLAPSTRATDLGISPQVTIATIWNNFENPKDGSFSMKHFEKCSYTIPESSPKDKWGVVAKAWANKVLFKTKVCLGW